MSQSEWHLARVNIGRARGSPAVAEVRLDHLGSVSVPHVFFGPLTLHQWVLFLDQHECRHAMQIRDIARQLAPA